jgi:hypothetical protein
MCDDVRGELVGSLFLKWICKLMRKRHSRYVTFLVDGEKALKG